MVSNGAPPDRAQLQRLLECLAACRKAVHHGAEPNAVHSATGGARAPASGGSTTVQKRPRLHAPCAPAAAAAVAGGHGEPQQVEQDPAAAAEEEEEEEGHVARPLFSPVGQVAEEAAEEERRGSAPDGPLASESEPDGEGEVGERRVRLRRTEPSNCIPDDDDD